jgi:hypothetical protein
MAKSFEELKKTAPQRFELLRSLMRPNLGSHKRIKLQGAGCGGSGSLLHNDVAKRHATQLFTEYKKRFGSLSKDGAQERLRFLTVLHSVTEKPKVWLRRWRHSRITYRASTTARFRGR